MPTGPTLRKPEVKPATPASHEESAPPRDVVPTVSLEYQRQQAKEMVRYFKQQKLEKEMERSQVFGWTKKNEILNGRWVMFGVGVGLLTEYATGVDFVHQLGLMLSYLGIVDID